MWYGASMSNMNVRRRVEKLSDDLDSVIKHVLQYSGIDKKDAMFIDNLATEMSAQAARLAGLSRVVQGDKSGASLEKRVRKALGYTHP